MAVVRRLKLSVLKLLLLVTISQTITSLSSSSHDAPIVIAGAGPAALVFANRVLNEHPTAVVHMYEKRARPPRYSGDEKEIAGDFAFGFGLTTRGLLALERVKWKDAIIAISRQSMTGTFMTNRRDMVAEMIHKCEREFSKKRFKVHFEFQVNGWNRNGTVQVVNCRDDSITCVDFSLLVAADGTNSNIRKSLVNMKLVKQTRYANCLSWKALQLPKQPAMLIGGFATHQSEDGKELCFVTPRFKDRFVLMFYRFNRGNPRAQANPMNVETVEELKSALITMFPNVTNFPSEGLMESFLQHSPGQEVYMTLNRHAVPECKVALIGDASVGTYALFGHGCVSAMERAHMLADCLANNTATEAALVKFSSRSLKEGRAISDLNLISHILRNKLLRNHALRIKSEIQRMLVTEPELTYSGILQIPEIKWTIRLSKLFWRFGRRKATSG